MQLRQFVLVCSVIILGWLAMAFVHEVPSSRYIRSAGNTDAASPPMADAAAGISGPDELAVSVSP